MKEEIKIKIERTNFGAKSAEERHDCRRSCNESLVAGNKRASERDIRRSGRE